MVFLGANHLFQWADTGRVDEYPDPDMASIPGFQEGIATWLTVRFLP